MKVNKIAVFALAALLCAGFVNARKVDATVATVNGRAILSSEFEKMRASVLAEYQRNAPQLLENKNNVTAISEEVLNQMITDAMLIQAARAEGIVVKNSELAQGINEIKARFARTPDGREITDRRQIERAFNEELKREGITNKQFENRIRDQIAVRKLIDSVVRANAAPPTRANVEQLFAHIQTVMGGNTKEIEKIPQAELEAAIPLAARLNQLTAEQVKVSPIFLRTDATMSAAVLRDKETQLRNIRRDIEAGKITFIEAIEKFSDDKSALATGGEAILVRGVMPKDFDDKVFAIGVGKISDPIRTEQGIYMLRVNEKRARRDVSLSMIENDLAQYLMSVSMQRATVDFITSLKEKADVKVMMKFEYDQPAAAAPAAAAPAIAAK